MNIRLKLFTFAAMFLCLTSTGMDNNISINLNKKIALENKLLTYMQACCAKGEQLRNSIIPIKPIENLEKQASEEYRIKIQDYITKKEAFRTLSIEHLQLIQTIEALEKKLCLVEQSIQNKSILNVHNYSMNNLEFLGGLLVVITLVCTQKAFLKNTFMDVPATQFVITLFFVCLYGICFELLLNDATSEDV